MRIRHLRVKNFRSILDAELSVRDLTALVGRNGTGKSAFLGALELFYERSAPLTEADFHGEDASQDIEIEISYGGLNSVERDKFAPYLEGETLTVVGVFCLISGKKSASFHGTSLQNAAFASIRRIDGKRDRVAEYDRLRQQPGYATLPTAKSADAAEAAMKDWELEHPDGCERIRDDGQFFGWSNVGTGRLRPHTQFIRIPAVRDAGEDAADQRGSPITEIMNLVVRSALAAHPKLNDLKERTRSEFTQIMDGDAWPKLEALQGELTDALQSFVPESAVDLRWEQMQELSIPDPQANVRLKEDGYLSTVTRTGHGLQRAFIVTLLQHLASVRQSNGATTPGTDTDAESEQLEAPVQPHVILAIEEPELYQHPSRQRHIASVLMRLTQPVNPETLAGTQVIYTTHSPLFVGLDRFDDVRILRKRQSAAEEPRATVVQATTLDAVAKQLQEATTSQADFTAESLRARLQTIMTPVVNEGFFADAAVLVEGDTDRAAIAGAARAMNIDLDAEGIAVIPCNGKTNLDRPLVIFRRLGIPTYVVWDGDQGQANSKPEPNRLLLRLLEMDETDWPSHVNDTSACFATAIEQTLKEETDPTAYERYENEAREFYGLPNSQMRKNALAFQRIVESSFKDGQGSPTLRAIVKNIAQLKTKAEPQ
ncbi:MAG: ATP-dependent endonuclease [Acidimicrobiia bacterium]|nr:ATP-dependent endonuclease [Acidimicrobiia bacterium]MCY4435058.1 ATP-dependent endonuclease [bacterium]